MQIKIIRDGAFFCATVFGLGLQGVSGLSKAEALGRLLMSKEAQLFLRATCNIEIVEGIDE